MSKKIFNLYQADLFIKKGATVDGIGLDKHIVFVEFKENLTFKELLKRWNNRTLSK